MKEDKVNISKYGYKVLQLETISTCNMECKFCSYPLRNDKNKILSDDKVYNIIDSLEMDEIFKFLTFSQLNEPLLDKRIFDFIKYAKERKVPVQIITNGILLQSSEVVDKLIDANPDHIKISLQTLNSSLFSESRRAKVSFQEYKNGIFEFLKAVTLKKAPINIYIVVGCNFNYPLKKIKSCLFGLDTGDPAIYNTVDDLKDELKAVLRELRAHNNNFLFDEQDLGIFLTQLRINYIKDPSFKIAENVHLKIKPFIYINRLTDFYPVRHSIGCNNKILAILASGNVVPCCIAYDEILTCGNIFNESFKEILEKNAIFFSDLKKGENLPLYCRRCVGAPSRRGVLIKNLKNYLTKKIRRKTNLYFRKIGLGL